MYIPSCGILRSSFESPSQKIDEYFKKAQTYARKTWNIPQSILKTMTFKTAARILEIKEFSPQFNTLKENIFFKNHLLAGNKDRTIVFYKKKKYCFPYLSFEKCHDLFLALIHLKFGSGTYKNAKIEIDLNTNTFVVRCTNHHASSKKSLLYEGKVQSLFVDHPQIVKIYDFYPISTQKTALIMEYCNGGDFNEYLKTFNLRNTSSQQEITKLFIDILYGLTILEEKKVTHNDISPENIYLTRNAGGGGYAKIGDFGLTHQQGSGVTVKGTPFYFSPEKIRALRLKESFDFSSKSDLWSFGLICYQVLTEKYLYEELGANTIEELSCFSLSQKEVNAIIFEKKSSTEFEQSLQLFLLKILKVDEIIRPSCAEAFEIFCDTFHLRKPRLSIRSEV